MFYANYDRLVTTRYCTLSLVLVWFNAIVILPIPWHRHVFWHYDTHAYYPSCHLAMTEMNAKFPLCISEHLPSKMNYLLIWLHVVVL